MEWANLVVNGTMLFLGALGGGLGTWIISLYKEQKVQAIASNDQAVQIYRELLDKISKKVEQLENNNNLLEKSYFELKEENFKLKVEKENWAKNHSFNENSLSSPNTIKS